MLHFYFNLKLFSTANFCKLYSFRLMVWQRILENSTSQEVTDAYLSEEIWAYTNFIAASYIYLSTFWFQSCNEEKWGLEIIV